MMREGPVLRTERLLLRPPALDDAARLRELAGAREVAANTINIPHPYEEGMADEWIRKQEEEFQEGRAVNFVIVLRSERILVGAIGLTLRPEHERAGMGYWIGVPYWDRGYCTEAARAVINYAFEERALNRVVTSHFGRNPASGRVMRKVGMKYEGTLRQHVKKWGEFMDMVHYGVLRGEYRADPPEPEG